MANDWRKRVQADGAWECRRDIADGFYILLESGARIPLEDDSGGALLLEYPAYTSRQEPSTSEWTCRRLDQPLILLESGGGIPLEDDSGGFLLLEHDQPWNCRNELPQLWMKRDPI